MKTKKTLAMVGIFLFLAIRPSVASSSTERTYLSVSYTHLRAHETG